MLWSHAYGLSACSLVTGLQDTVRVPYRFRMVHVRAPYGLWIPYGHGNIRTFSFAGTVRSRVDALWAWEYIVPVRSVVQALRSPVRPTSARLGYIYQPNTLM